MVGKFVDDAAQAPAIEEFFVFFADVQHDLGTARCALDVLDRVAALAARLPTHTLVGLHAGATGGQGDLVGDDEGGIKADTELADELAVLGLVTRQVLEEFLGARAGDRADGLVDLLAAHADAVVLDRDRAGFLIDRYPDAQRRVALVKRVIAERFETQLFSRVGGIRDQLPQKDLFVGIE